MIPPGYEGGATTASCSDPATNLDVRAAYTTTVNPDTGDTVSLVLEAFGTPSSGGTYGCQASVDASFLPMRSVYFKETNINNSEYSACRESVVDFCESDPAPAVP